MWALPDLSKLGDQLGEALQKAKDDMEKSIDTTLGIGNRAAEPETAPAAAGAWVHCVVEQRRVHAGAQRELAPRVSGVHKALASSAACRPINLCGETPA